jgi:hypothetical protein
MSQSGHLPRSGTSFTRNPTKDPLLMDSVQNVSNIPKFESSLDWFFEDLLARKPAKNRRWAEYMNSLDNEDDKNNLHTYRDELVNFIIANFCNQNACVKYGSTELTSDVDVSIKGLENGTSLETLMVIKKFLEGQFSKHTVFHVNGQFSIYEVYRFFDMNFYLTDFEIAKSTAYPLEQSGAKCMSQYFYAFTELFHADIDDAPIKSFKGQFYSIHETEIGKLIPSDHGNNTQTRRTLIATAVHKKISNEQRDSAHDNQVINMISLLSTTEDECYHTQGAYVHVVHYLQKRHTNVDGVLDKYSDVWVQMLCASAIENLCYAYTHSSNRTKYVNRVNEAYKTLTPLIASVQATLLEKAIYSCLPLRTYTDYDIREALLRLLGIIITPLAAHGGSRIECFKKLIDKQGHSVKKNIKGRARVIYVDSRRRQYVKYNNQYVPLVELRRRGL